MPINDATAAAMSPRSDWIAPSNIATKTRVRYLQTSTEPRSPNVFAITKAELDRICLARSEPTTATPATTAIKACEAAIAAWKRDSEHQKAQHGGRESWYEHFHVRVAKVERAYGK